MSEGRLNRERIKEYIAEYNGCKSHKKHQATDIKPRPQAVLVLTAERGVETIQMRPNILWKSRPEKKGP
jgi:hypothetical protein